MSKAKNVVVVEAPSVTLGGKTVKFKDPGFAQYYAVRFGSFSNFAMTCVAMVGICWADSATRPNHRGNPFNVETYALGVLEDLHKRGVKVGEVNAASVVVMEFLARLYGEDMEEPTNTEVNDAVDFCEPPEGGD